MKNEDIKDLILEESATCEVETPKKGKAKRDFADELNDRIENGLPLKENIYLNDPNIHVEFHGQMIQIYLLDKKKRDRQELLPILHMIDILFEKLNKKMEVSCVFLVNKGKTKLAAPDAAPLTRICDLPSEED
jgi:hypothetical protein